MGNLPAKRDLLSTEEGGGVEVEWKICCKNQAMIASGFALPESLYIYVYIVMESNE